MFFQKRNILNSLKIFLQFSFSWFQDKLALNITTEQGKTLKDAHGDVFRGLGYNPSPLSCSLSTLVIMRWESSFCYMTYAECLISNWNGLSYVEVVEHACGMASLQMGEYVSNVSHGIDTYSIREPLGVCAGICPFNFPAMISLWVSLLFFTVIPMVIISAVKN